METSPRLYFSRRRMLNRLGFEPKGLVELADPETGQTIDATRAILLHLEEMGLADENREHRWTISDEGIAAMAANGVIYAES